MCVCVCVGRTAVSPAHILNLSTVTINLYKLPISFVNPYYCSRNVRSA